MTTKILYQSETDPYRSLLTLIGKKLKGCLQPEYELGNATFLELHDSRNLGTILGLPVKNICKCFRLIKISARSMEIDMIKVSKVDAYLI